MALIVINVTVTTAGTAVQVSATSRVVHGVVVQARGGDNANTGANTGKIFIGPSTVDNSGTTGIQLAAPAAGSTPPSFNLSDELGSNAVDLQDIWVDAGVNGEGVVVLGHEH